MRSSADSTSEKKMLVKELQHCWGSKIDNLFVLMRNKIAPLMSSADAAAQCLYLVIASPGMNSGLIPEECLTLCLG